MNALTRTRSFKRRSVSAAAVAAMAVLASGCAMGSAPAEPVGRDHLVLTVSNSANPNANGTFDLWCNPAAGDHSAVDAACAKLAGFGPEQDPFAPVPADAICTQQYGGPEVAHVAGTWAGRPVDATFNRTNGCEIRRWDSLVPLLPEAPA
ncbi:SSI family serine proteinase inhibitor [Nocardia altamirensis]|uniref:SSI family serine proteinase inhibitor n=1 Tax=Nocardia altamirensis TaxID=472158 RepID=UPI00084032F1|nr:SSI family serine proteinase inhibitor [Nocardia altamirensis]